MSTEKSDRFTSPIFVTLHAQPPSPSSLILVIPFKPLLHIITSSPWGLNRITVYETIRRRYVLYVYVMWPFLFNKYRALFSGQGNIEHFCRSEPTKDPQAPTTGRALCTHRRLDDGHAQPSLQPQEYPFTYQIFLPKAISKSNRKVYAKFTLESILLPQPITERHKIRKLRFQINK